MIGEEPLFGMEHFDVNRIFPNLNLHSVHIPVEMKQ
jgi:hypothetical protein